MAAIEKNNEWVDDILEEGEVDESMPGKENNKLRCNVEGCQGKAFAKPFSLLRHWAEIHEQQVTLYECEGCTKVFRRATDVKRHSLQKHQAEAKAIPINRQNKFYLAPGSAQPPTGYKKKVLPTVPPSQMAFVPKEAPARQIREPLVALSQAASQQEVLTTSRDILVKNLRKADAKLKFWTEEREKARAQLEQFDKEKKEALVKDLQHKLREERRQRKIYEDKNSLMTEQIKVLKQSEETIRDLKRKLTAERDLRRESEARIRKMTAKSEIAKKQDFIDFVNINFE